MKLYEKDNSIILEEIENFDAKAILLAGRLLDGMKKVMEVLQQSI